VHTAGTAVFVGRDAELGALHDAFAEASEGRSQVLVVEGEAGIGKTTLVERFAAEVPGARLLCASGDESESHVPFAMVDQLLRAEGRRCVTLRAGGHLAAGLELLELISAGEDETCVLVVDDAHLIDADSLRALLFAARRLLGGRVLVVLIVRGSAEDALPVGWRKLATGATGGVLSVGPLAPAHISALGSALGLEMTPDAAGRLWEHTRGNPLHARAVLCELPRDASWQHEPRLLPVPKSYAQLISERLHRCHEDVVGLVAAAAVLGLRAPCAYGVRPGVSREAARDPRRRHRERARASRRGRRRSFRRVLSSADAGGDLRRPADRSPLGAQHGRGADRR
jgi:hypothetical protein